MDSSIIFGALLVVSLLFGLGLISFDNNPNASGGQPE